MSLTLLKPGGAVSPDAELAGRIARGDSEALCALMRRCNQTLYRTARSSLRDDADAEEAVQEAYFKAYRVMASFRGDASLNTWLVRIVVNESKQRLRQRKRRLGLVPLADLGGHLPDLPEKSMYEATSGLPPAQFVLQAQTRKLLGSKSDQLPDSFRMVLVLRAVEEMSVEEVADCLDIPGATVRTRYFRARARAGARSWARAACCCRARRLRCWPDATRSPRAARRNNRMCASSIPHWAPNSRLLPPTSSGPRAACCKSRCGSWPCPSRATTRRMPSCCPRRSRRWAAGLWRRNTSMSFRPAR